MEPLLGPDKTALHRIRRRGVIRRNSLKTVEPKGGSFIIWLVVGDGAAAKGEMSAERNRTGRIAQSQFPSASGLETKLET